MVIDKDKFIQTYGINDDNFIAYLNKFGTLKKIVNMCRLDVISKEKLNHLYNRFIYYKSIGHNINTILEETSNFIISLFYFGGDGDITYILPISNSIELSEDFNCVAIVGKMCFVRIYFTPKTEIKNNSLLFELLPAPKFDHGIEAYTSNGNVLFFLTKDGLILDNGTIQANSKVRCSLCYPIRK